MSAAAVDSVRPVSHGEWLRMAIDDSVASPTLLFFVASVNWLLLGSILGLAAALKFNMPDWLGQWAPLTFGRLRPAHLNAVVYGWSSLCGAGMTIWLTARLGRTPLQWTSLLYVSLVLWNVGTLFGTVAVLAGYSNGMEFLEFPLPAVALIAVAFVCFALSILRTFAARNVDHVYVSLWYILAAMVWFPLVYIVPNLGLYHGVTQAAVNWWYAHNLLTVWVTPLGLAGAYYFIPKVLGRPIYSYYLGLLGFWTFALFYNWNGLHHLIGGPMPTWAITVSVVASMMMVIPVVAVAINHHMSMGGRFEMLRYSPTLRFCVFGAMCYTAVSLQGSSMALRSLSEITHFTHYTVGHAHLGVYAFMNMILFGAIYYIMPRVSKWEWPYPNLIRAHFWLVAVGVLMYVAALTFGGFVQGLYMNNPARPFMDSVAVTRWPLWFRSLGGGLMLLGHFVFAFHFAHLVHRMGPQRLAPPWLQPEEGEFEPAGRGI